MNFKKPIDSAEYNIHGVIIPYLKIILKFYDN